MKVCTINTDASFNRMHKIGSYAFWIVADELKILKAGILRKRCDRPEEAEFKCIVNAISVLFSSHNLRELGIQKIIVNTDCLNVIHVFKKQRWQIKMYGLNFLKPFADKIEALRHEYNYNHIPIEFRHVKGHTGAADARSYVNDWCDKHAKKHINIAINRILTKNPQTV